MSATDASAQEADRVTLKYLAIPENAGLKNVAYEHFNNTDLSVSAQIARIKAAAPQAMIAYASGPAFIAIMRTLKDAGLDIPVLTSTANLVPSVLTQNKDILPHELLFNAFAYEAGDLLGRGALRNVAREFVDGCKAAGIEATPVGALAWDPAKLIVGALRSLGPNATSEQVRAFLAGTHDVAGVMGIYDFRKRDQHGLSDSAVVIVRWDPTRGSEVPVSRLGGVPIAQ
jgi:branched-chain amino acid transport system substrate-binding protein